MEAAMKCWASFLGPHADEFKASFLVRLQAEGLDVTPVESDGANGPGICVASDPSPQLHDMVRGARNAGLTEIIVILGPNSSTGAGLGWELLSSGASDVLVWTDLDQIGRAHV